MKINGYEFYKKEIREEFKKTEFGASLNRRLAIWVTLALVALVATVICGILKEEPVLESGLFITLVGLTAAFWLIASYYDGKRDGAITQFAKDKKK